MVMILRDFARLFWKINVVLFIWFTYFTEFSRFIFQEFVNDFDNNCKIICAQIQQTMHDELREDYHEYLEEKLSQAKSQSDTSLSDHENADKISLRSNKPDENGQFLSVMKKVMFDVLQMSLRWWEKLLGFRKLLTIVFKIVCYPLHTMLCFFKVHVFCMKSCTTVCSLQSN